MSQEKFTNIVGVPLKEYVKKQLYTRSFQGSTIDSRTNDQILYLANKNCWIRLVSFVNVGDEQLRKNLDIEGKQKAGTPIDVSKQWVLFGGTSYYQNDTNNLRFGLETNDPSRITNNSAYGLGGVEQFGYRPMPGIISATIDHAGTAGSLRIANIKFKVWNINQLNAIDTLYFRLGYSCLLEWGHTSYLDNNTSKLVTLGSEINPLDIFNNDIYKTKEGIIRGISDKRKKSFGNYDGLYGLISNYEWSQAEDGSYDCSIKLTGLGSVIDSLKINQAFNMSGDESKSSIQSSNDNTTQIVSDNINTSRPTKPYIPIGSNIISWPEIGASLDVGDGALINFEQLQKRKSVLDELISKSIITKDKGITIKYIYTNKKDKKELFLSKEYLKDNPLLKQGLFGYVEILYDRLIQIGNTDVKDNFYISSEEYQTKPVEQITPKVWTLESVSSNLIKLTKSIELKSEDTISVFTKKSSEDQISTETQNGITFNITDTANRNLRNTSIIPFTITNILIEITFNTNYSENFDIIKPLIRLNQGAQQIQTPALRRFYLNYITNKWSTAEYTKKFIYGETSAKESITISLLRADNISSNAIKISALIQTEDIISENTNPGSFKQGFRIQAAQYAVQQIFNSIELFDTDIQKQLYRVINIDSENNSIYEGDVYRKSQTKQRLNIATIIYDYDEKKLLNSSNAQENIPGESLTTSQYNIAEKYFSNIDKFLIELRDFAAQSTITAGEVSGSYDFITKQLKNGPLDPIRTTYQNNVFSELTSEVNKLNIERQLSLYINKGFNSETLSGELEASDQIPNVDFEKLFKIYKSGLTIVGNADNTSTFYYIKLGLLLYYINNNSIFYERDESGNIKKPFIYIDFNPETNFCFTTPYQFSIDPGVCMIKINLNNDAYQQLFPINTKPDDIFNNSLDSYSPYLYSGFADDKDTLVSRGKLMNIPVNIDHIINIIQSQSNNNPKTDVYLRSFLEILMDDINKSLGNINSFRIGYYDDANTVRIYDDQVINPPINQSLISIDDKISSLLPIEPTIIPLIGKNSIVRSLQLKTEVSTKMSQMIAFSSQAGNLGSLNTDSSALGYINNNLVDRILPVKETSLNSGSINNVQSNVNADKDAAKIFNNTVIDIYKKGQYIQTDVNTSKIYYTTAANRLKADKDSTKARQVLPISINIGMDGISGMTLLEGFTVPKDVLPSQYLDTKGFNRVGFAVAGLNHTIDNNQWVTTIRGQMINIPTVSALNTKDFGTIDISAGGGQPVKGNFIISQESININISSLNINERYLEIAIQFIANEEKFIKAAKWDANAYRVGYGNDQYIDTDNKLKPVTASTVITQTQALQTLKYTVINRFQPIVISNLGKDNWNKLNDNQKAALLSYAYNVGSIKSVSNPIKNNNYRLAAQEIQRGPITSKGKVLPGLIDRRRREASLFLS
jgi:GH24 family phage-related lysozyme (muramidase)